MDWRRWGAKPLPEPMVIYYTEAYTPGLDELTLKILAPYIYIHGAWLLALYMSYII